MREMGGCCLICHFLIWKIIFYSVSYLLSAFIGCWLPSLSLVCMGGDRLCCTKQKSRPTSGQDAAALWLPLSDAWSALTGCWNTGLSIGSQEHRPLRTAYKRFFEHGKGWGTLKVVIFWVLQQYFSSLLARGLKISQGFRFLLIWSPHTRDLSIRIGMEHLLFKDMRGNFLSL